VKLLPWGFIPLRDISLGVHLTPGSQSRRRSVLSVSHALDGLLRLWPCGSISPRCHVQGLLFRGFPLGEAVPPRRWPTPSSLTSIRCSMSPSSATPRRPSFRASLLRDPSSVERV
jgi:hypothetical protein